MFKSPKCFLGGLVALGFLLVGCGGGGSSTTTEVEGIATANSVTAVSPTD